MLLSVPFQEDTDAEALLIYILIEHQSTVDKTMGFRLLSYMVANLGVATAGMGNGRRFLKMKGVYNRSCRSCFIRRERPWPTPVSLTTIMDVPEILERFRPKL